MRARCSGGANCGPDTDGPTTIDLRYALTPLSVCLSPSRSLSFPLGPSRPAIRWRPHPSRLRYDASQKDRSGWKDGFETREGRGGDVGDLAGRPSNLIGRIGLRDRRLIGDDLGFEPNEIRVRKEPGSQPIPRSNRICPLSRSNSDESHTTKHRHVSMPTWCDLHHVRTSASTSNDADLKRRERDERKTRRIEMDGTRWCRRTRLRETPRTCFRSEQTNAARSARRCTLHACFES